MPPGQARIRRVTPLGRREGREALDQTQTRASLVKAIKCHPMQGARACPRSRDQGQSCEALDRHPNSHEFGCGYQPSEAASREKSPLSFQPRFEVANPFFATKEHRAAKPHPNPKTKFLMQSLPRMPRCKTDPSIFTGAAERTEIRTNLSHPLRPLRP